MLRRRSQKFPRIPFILVFLLVAGCTTLKRCAYEGVGRESWQKPDEVIQAIGLRPGDKVADLGSGSGYFTFRLASAVGPSGAVYAVDVDRGLNEYVADRARREGFKNIKVILAKYDDPLLPESAIDVILTVNTYHHIENRVRYFTNVKKYLKRHGRIVVIDFNSRQWFEIFGGHFIPIEVVKEEMEEAGYVLKERLDFLPRQYFLVFSKTP